MTSYRDDNEALQARIRELEGALAAERAHVTRLKGASPKKRRGKSDSLVGEVLHHQDTIELEGAVNPQGLLAIAEVLRSRWGREVVVRDGTIRAHARGLDAADGPKSFALERTPDGTNLKMETDVRRLPILVALGPVLGTMTSLPLALWQMDVLHHFEHGLDLSTTLSVAAACTLLGGFATRWWSQRRALRARHDHDGVWETVTELARERLVPTVRARVEPMEESANVEAPLVAEETQRQAR